MKLSLRCRTQGSNLGWEPPDQWPLPLRHELFGAYAIYVASHSPFLGRARYLSDHMINGTVSPNPPYRYLIGFGTAIGQILVRWAATRSYGT